MNESLLTLLNLLNESLAAAIVVIAVSLLLYNLTRNVRDRVARTSASVLAAVTVPYVCDVFLALEPGAEVVEAALRLQWIGVALIPAALFHLSDALLATTGLPSRGRRRRVVRVLYLIAGIFILFATLTDWLIAPLPGADTVSLRAAPLMVVYLAYFLIVCTVAYINVDRARRRCLTRSTKRRMGYLQIAFLTPAVGIFPYSVFLAPGDEFTLPALILVAVANFVVVMMLLFLAYPLSFFGSRVPDRVVKTELLRFLLRGPATGLLVLGVIIFLDPVSQILGLTGSDFTPFAVVATVLFWQWMVDLSLPALEHRLIYPSEDEEQINRVQELSRYLLTQQDFQQLIEAILEASCDYLQVERAFIASFYEPQPEIVHTVGAVTITQDSLTAEWTSLRDLLQSTDHDPEVWCGYWVLPLRYTRSTNGSTSNGEHGNTPPTLIGMLAVEARAEPPDLSEEESHTLHTFQRRAARTLDDLRLQGEINAALEGLLPQIAASRLRSSEVEYRPGRAPIPVTESETLPLARDEIVPQVQAALRHYWGGPGLSESRLLQLTVVRQALDSNENEPIKALRSVLVDAIERQKPDGERSMRSPEWTLYNILQLRFLDSRKVRDTAKRLYMSEANLYRKQNLAIEAVADTLIRMESEVREEAASGN